MMRSCCRAWKMMRLGFFELEDDAMKAEIKEQSNREFVLNHSFTSLSPTEATAATTITSPPAYFRNLQHKQLRFVGQHRQD
ncbi:hypothetical protein L1987_43555 [Smallanthus sonchifolius]|uniref:Uncharacterized protein n=1 Tax=Smallanthus sonchifolius TaxID=185202 RepID=A0ACB9GMZ6_9ASTR|nr:hypothetical protein L1987_43555 [Smallanthus sonchifolius]